MKALGLIIAMALIYFVVSMVTLKVDRVTFQTGIDAYLERNK